MGYEKAGLMRPYSVLSPPLRGYALARHPRYPGATLFLRQSQKGEFVPTDTGYELIVPSAERNLAWMDPTCLPAGQKRVEEGSS